jgi:hypothetical protein
MAYYLRLTVFLLLSFYTILGYSQHYQYPPNLPKYDRNPYHFGFILGLNSMNYVIRNKENLKQFDTVQRIESTPQKGFTIGIVSNLRLWCDYVDLRFIPSLSFGGATLLYTLNETNHPSITEIKTTEITNLEFPFSVKVKSQRFWNNVRAYVMGGVKYSIDMASQAKQKEATDVYIVRLNRGDYTYELGTGFDFYLDFFKLGVELKMDYGMRDMLKRDNTVYTNSIDKLSSKMFLLSFTFE